MVGPRTWTLRERWHSKEEEPHYTETADDLTYFSICQNSSADLNSTITVLVQSYRVKHFPIWCKGANDISLLSTEEWGRRWFFLIPPHFSFDYKKVAHLLPEPDPSCLLICTFYKYLVLITLLNCFSHVWLCTTLWTAACQAPLFMGFSRQEYWSGLPCSLPGDLPDQGIKLASLRFPSLAGRFFTCRLGNPLIILLLAYHFASHWIPSVLRHKEHELHWVLWQVVKFQLEYCGLKSPLRCAVSLSVMIQ